MFVSSYEKELYKKLSDEIVRVKLVDLILYLIRLWFGWVIKLLINLDFVYNWDEF